MEIILDFMRQTKLRVSVRFRKSLFYCFINGREGGRGGEENQKPTHSRFPALVLRCVTTLPIPNNNTLFRYIIRFFFVPKPRKCRIYMWGKERHKKKLLRGRILYLRNKGLRTKSSGHDSPFSYMRVC